MQKKNKYVKSLRIGAVTGGLICGGICISLTGRKPFIRDYINTYRVTRDTTIKTIDGLTRLNQTSDFLTSNEIEKMNELEVKSYTQVGDSYDVDLYGFTNGSLKDDEITIKQNEFENGNSLSTITNYDNYNEYQVENRELPDSYENILEEINIRNVDYNSVIKVRESRKTNIEDTAYWFLITVSGVLVGVLCERMINSIRNDLKIIKKLK